MLETSPAAPTTAQLPAKRRILMERLSTRLMWTRTKCILALLLLTSLWPRAAAQQARTPASAPAPYDAKREMTVLGAVVACTQTPQALPFGACITFETSAGTVDVHLGGPKFLAANQFAIQPGDSLRPVGEAVAYGTGSQFVARVVQKGTRALMVRSVSGFPLSYAAPRSSLNSQPRGGVL